jgi:hypothetical protein
MPPSYIPFKPGHKTNPYFAFFTPLDLNNPSPSLAPVSDHSNNRNHHKKGPIKIIIHPLIPSFKTLHSDVFDLLKANKSILSRHTTSVTFTTINTNYFNRFHVLF